VPPDLLDAESGCLKLEILLQFQAVPLRKLLFVFKTRMRMVASAVLIMEMMLEILAKYGSKNLNPNAAICHELYAVWGKLAEGLHIETEVDEWVDKVGFVRLLKRKSRSSCLLKLFFEYLLSALQKDSGFGVILNPFFATTLKLKIAATVYGFCKEQGTRQGERFWKELVGLFSFDQALVSAREPGSEFSAALDEMGSAAVKAASNALQLPLSCMQSDFDMLAR